MGKVSSDAVNVYVTVSGFSLNGSHTYYFPGNCTNGDIRLEGGRNPKEGRVEVCVGDHWVTVCYDGWTSTQAKVVCRQLNYSSSGSSNANVH